MSVIVGLPVVKSRPVENNLRLNSFDVLQVAELAKAVIRIIVYTVGVLETYVSTNNF